MGHEVRARGRARARARARRPPPPSLSPHSGDRRTQARARARLPTSTRAPSPTRLAPRAPRARAQFIELKNTNAAIEEAGAGRDPARLPRVYGLGQTYEIIGMHFYALHYYQKATTLRPYDSRMWVATAACYEKLERWADAIRAYEVRGAEARARRRRIGAEGFRPARRARGCVCA